MFIDGYLASGFATGPSGFTELTTPGYGRQPISFGIPVKGVCYSSRHFNFGAAIRAGTCRAIFNTATGGNCLLILPMTMPPPSARQAWDTGDVGFLRLIFTAMQSYASGAAFSAPLAAPGQAIGTCNDDFDVSNRIGTISGIGLAVGQNAPANPAPVINTAVMSAGAYLQVSNGVLSLQLNNTNQDVVIPSAGAAQGLVWPPFGTVAYDLTLTAPSCAITLATGQAGQTQVIQMTLRQDATGGRTVIWPAGITWQTGTPPVLSTAPGAVNVVTLTTSNGGAAIAGVQNS